MENKLKEIWQEVSELSDDDSFWEEQEEAEQEFIKSQEEAYLNHS